MYLILGEIKYKINDYSSFFKKTIGLMFRKKRINEIYMFKNCNSIHTFFMRQNIDVIMTDKDYNILLLEKNFKKNKIIIKKEACYTFECPLNVAKYLKINDKLKIEVK